MKTLQECTWKEFEVGKLLNVQTTKHFIQQEMQDGSVPFVTRSTINNGISGFVLRKTEQLCEGVCITIGAEGAVAFYQEFSFLPGVKIYTLRHKNLNRYTAMFLCVLLNQQTAVYSYGYARIIKKIVREHILLPVTPAGTPDWQYMEDYMREVEKKLQAQTLPSLRAKATQQSTQPNGTLEQQDWKEFALNDIFSIRATQSGIDRNKLVAGEGNTPYITRTDMNNGWDSFICEQPKYRLDEGNVISVGLDTQTVFYQPCSFYTGQNIQVFSSPQLNRYVAAFIIPLLKIQMQKFNWGGNGATLGRLKRSKILLPVTPDGTPDYAFMENYMRAVEAKQIRHYLDKKK